MIEVLRQCELCEGLTDPQLRSLVGITRYQAVPAGQYLFMLGDAADRLFVVLGGRLDVCFPLSLGGALRDVSVETAEPGSALGWSALVRPYRFTLSARAAETCEIAAFARRDLQALFDADPKLGAALMARVAEVVGRRLLTIQALLARELQRTLGAGWPEAPARTRAS